MANLAAALVRGRYRRTVLGPLEPAQPAGRALAGGGAPLRLRRARRRQKRAAPHCCTRARVRDLRPRAGSPPGQPTRGGGQALGAGRGRTRDSRGAYHHQWVRGATDPALGRPDAERARRVRGDGSEHPGRYWLGPRAGEQLSVREVRLCGLHRILARRPDRRLAAARPFRPSRLSPRSGGRGRSDHPGGRRLHAFHLGVHRRDRARGLAERAAGTGRGGAGVGRGDRQHHRTDRPGPRRSAP